MNGLRNILTFSLLLLFWLPFNGFAQEYRFPEGKTFEKIQFEMVNNLIIIPIEVNGVKLSFILDSGVRKPILFNLSDQDSISLNNVSEISIRGLGTGEPIKALVSKGNTFKIKGITNPQQKLYVVLDKEMNFSPRLGMPIHGIIGYDLFRDFVVDINYHAQSLKLHDPRYYKTKVSKKDQVLPITIIGNKSYIDGSVVMDNNQEIDVKLLVDTGSGDAVWLFKDLEKGLGIPENSFQEYLGKGLNGHIFGRRTKVKGIKIGRFELEDVKAAFPYMESYAAITNLGDRNGSVGGEILKRFNIVFNYGKGEIVMRKNGLFNQPFHYNISGIDIRHSGMRYIAEKIKESRVATVGTTGYTFGNVQLMKEDVTRLSLVPEIVVSGIRAGSPAAEAGLREGDIIIAINGKKIHRYKLQEVVKLLNEKEGKRIQVLIERYNQDLLFSFVLENVLK